MKAEVYGMKICSIPHALPFSLTVFSSLHVPSSLLSFSLIQRIAPFAVKVAKVFGLDEIKTLAGNPAEQVNDLLMRDGRAVGLGHKTAAPVIGAERFGFASRPDLHTAIADHCEL